MKVVFYSCLDDRRKKNKTRKNIIATVTVSMESGSSIYKPVLVIQKESLANFSSCNYCYIMDYDRYYFIEDIVTKRGGLLTISCSCDVLMSFKDEINGLTTLIVRNEFDKDMTIQDSEFITKVQRDITYKNFGTSPFSLNSMNNGVNCIALTVNGGGA